MEKRVLHLLALLIAFAASNYLNPVGYASQEDKLPNNTKLITITEGGKSSFFDGHMLQTDDCLMMITPLEDGTIEIESCYLFNTERLDGYSLVIPATLYGHTVSSFGSKAFHNSSFISIIIPETVISIGERAFEDCRNLTSIVIPEGVTSISDGTFYGCESLTSIIIPDTVSSIGDDVFHDCEKLETVTIPNSVTLIRETQM